MVLLSVLLALAALEGIVRLFGMVPPMEQDASSGLRSLLTFDQILETKYIPGASARIKSPYGEFDVAYRVNEFGLRGSQIAPKREDEKLVLVLGNSFVEGWGVEEETTFVSVAQGVVRDKRKSLNSAPVRIVNGGVSGYGAAQLYLNLQRIWPAVSPDVVVLAIVGTMVNSDYKYLSSARINPEGIATGLSASAILSGGTPQTFAQQPASSKWLDYLSRYLATVRLVRNRFANEAAMNEIKAGDPVTDLLAAYRADRVTLGKIFEPTLRHVSAIGEFAQSKGAKFILLYLPMPFQLSDNAWDVGRKAYRLSKLPAPDGELDVIRSFCLARRLECLFPTDMLREALASQGKREIYFHYDFHMTSEGNRILGTWLGNELAKSVQ